MIFFYFSVFVIYPYFFKIYQLSIFFEFIIIVFTNFVSYRNYINRICNHYLQKKNWKSEIDMYEDDFTSFKCTNCFFRG